MHAIAMHGTPAYSADFTHFKYTNPSARAGGTLSQGKLGTFDSLNPFIIKGVAAAGVREHVYESLMARGFDEAFTLYGLIAKTIDVPEDRSWVSFELNPAARFSDSHPLTVEDVIFSFETLRKDGRPNHQHYYGKVDRIEKIGTHGIKFIFGAKRDRELPLILGLMPILPKHINADKAFNVTSLAKPIGSGAYVVETVVAGTQITYRRNPDYWGKNLAVNAGRFNIDHIVYDYYRDDVSAFEAFKSGLNNFRFEQSPAKWATAYTFKAVKDKRVVLDEYKTRLPSGLYGLVFNTRRKIFADINVRKALMLLFDGKWIDKNLYHGKYRRTQSYFGNSKLSYRFQPASTNERALLKNAGATLPTGFLDNSYQLSLGDGSGRNRSNLRQALNLFNQSGYVLSGGKLVNKATRQPFQFEVLVGNREQERLVLSYATSLKRVGIKVFIRQVDSTQFEQRKQTYDFDMIPYFWFASLSPGNEQSFYWGSAGRKQPGTRNYMGANDPAIDWLIAALVKARTPEKFTTVARALDRLLMSHHYVIPLFHLPAQWVAHARELHAPNTTSAYGYKIDTWWLSENQ